MIERRSSTTCAVVKLHDRRCGDDLCVCYHAMCWQKYSRKLMWQSVEIVEDFILVWCLIVTLAIRRLVPVISLFPEQCYLKPLFCCLSDYEGLSDPGLIEDTRSSILSTFRAYAAGNHPFFMILVVTIYCFVK